jgi:hypothetical protein
VRLGDLEALGVDELDVGEEHLDARQADARRAEAHLRGLRRQKQILGAYSVSPQPWCASRPGRGAVVSAVVVAVVNRKGGVGKTSVRKDLGSALAERGVRVLLVGLDPQSSLEVLAGLGADTAPGRTVSRLLLPEESPAPTRWRRLCTARRGKLSSCRPPAPRWPWPSARSPTPAAAAAASASSAASGASKSTGAGIWC